MQKVFIPPKKKKKFNKKFFTLHHNSQSNYSLTQIHQELFTYYEFLLEI